MAYTTYFDLVESLIVSSYGGPQDAEQRDIRSAILKAYDELTSMRDWACYQVHGRLILQAPYSAGKLTSSGTTVTNAISCTGTAATDTITSGSHGLSSGDTVKFASLTGGSGLSTGTTYYVVSATASTFQLATTSGGSPVSFGTDITAGVYGGWPAWVTSGHIRIGKEVVKVASKSSANTIILDASLPLKSDMTDVAYTLYRSVYPLPSDFKNLDEPSSEYNWWAGLYVNPDQAMKLERVWVATGAPFHWTVLRENNQWVIKLVGYPIKVETLDFTYRRLPRRLRFSGHEANSRAGTISRSGTTVTLSGATTFVDAFDGAVLRVGDSSSHPGPPESLNPYVSESLIESITSSSVLETQATGTIAAGTKYLITDPVDIAPHMQAAMDAACQYYLARIRKSGEDKAFQFYQRDLRLALERDQLAPLAGRSRQIYHDGGWRSPLKVDKGA